MMAQESCNGDIERAGEPDIGPLTRRLFPVFIDWSGL